MLGCPVQDGDGCRVNALVNIAPDVLRLQGFAKLKVVPFVRIFVAVIAAIKFGERDSATALRMSLGCV